VEGGIAIHESMAGRRVRLQALVSCGLFFVVAVAGLAFASNPGYVSYPFIGLTAAASIAGCSFTALLLFLESRVVRSAITTVLGMGFALAAATTVVYAVIVPGMFGEAQTPPDTWSLATLLAWLSWHIAIIVAIYAFESLRSRTGTRVAHERLNRVAISVGTIGFLVILGAALLARTVVLPFPWIRIIPAVGFVILPACIVLVRAIRRPTVTTLDLGFAIVAFAMILDTILTSVSPQPFSAPWYAARFEAQMSSWTVLTILINQAIRMYGELLNRSQVLEGEAHTDVLTGLPNRRRFDEELVRSFGSAARRQAPLALAMIDIDHFKRYNDTFGHQAGDVALRRIAQALARGLDRSRDLVARYGGEEFVLILEETDLSGALAVIKRIRGLVADAAIEAPGGGHVTVSVGVAIRTPGETPRALLNRADGALYRAKHAGRNCVVADGIDVTLGQRTSGKIFDGV